MEEHYLQLFLAERKKQLLPFLFWYIHNQRLQKKRIDSLLSRTYDVQDCSERLQILWGFYERLPHTDAKAAQSYIMKECLPLLSELALEFQLVFLHELQLLITRTRNYKDLYNYMEQLHL